MADLTKFPTSNAGDGTGYANPTYFYADDGNYATALPNKNNSLAHYVGGFDFSAIGDGDTLNSVTVYIQYKYSTDTANYTLGSQGYVGETAKGSEYTNTNTPTADTDVNYEITGLTIADVKDENFRIRIRCSRGNTNTASTQSVDFIKVEVVYVSAITGTLSKTLDSPSISATATVTVKGELDKTTGALSLVSEGTVEGDVQEPIEGALSQQLGAASITATGGVRVDGVLSQQLGTVGITSSGGVQISGALSGQLQTAVLSSAGGVSVTGVFNQGLDALTGNNTGKVYINGALVGELDAASLVSEGGITAIISGSLSQALAGIGISAQATNLITGLLENELAGITGDLSGGVEIKAALTGQLNDVVLSAEGVGVEVVVTEGTLNKQLDILLTTSSGVVEIKAALQKSLDGVGLSAGGSVIPIAVGTANIPLDDVLLLSSGTAQALPTIEGILNVILTGVLLGSFNLPGKEPFAVSVRRSFGTGTIELKSRGISKHNVNPREIYEVNNGN